MCARRGAPMRVRTQFVHIAPAGCAVSVLTIGVQREQPRSSVVTTTPSSDNPPAPALPDDQRGRDLFVFQRSFKNSGRDLSGRRGAVLPRAGVIRAVLSLCVA